MVLTKQELISSLRNEVRILLHLTGKIDKAKLDYRPTPKQRSFLDLIQYMAIMGPTMVQSIEQGIFTREAMTAIWGPAEAAAKAMNFDQAVAAIEKQPGEYARLLGRWNDDELRSEIDIFGSKTTRGGGGGEYGSDRPRRVPHATVLLPEVHRPRGTEHHQLVDGHRRDDVT
jgi:hypothetical protein